MKMTEPQQETYTLNIEELLNIFLDGMTSGVTTTLINEKYGYEQIEEARAESNYHMMRFIDDPALVESVRDTIRSRINGTPWERQVLKVKGLDQ